MAMDARLVASDVGSVSACLHPAGWPVPSDQQRSDLSHDRDASSSAPTGGSTGFCHRRSGSRCRSPSRYTRSDVNPQLLTGTDIRGDALQGLRKPHCLERQLQPGHPPEPAWQQLAGSRAGGSVFGGGGADPGPRPAPSCRTRTAMPTPWCSATTCSFSGGDRGCRSAGVVKGLPKWIRESEGGKALAGCDVQPGALQHPHGAADCSRDQADYSLFSVPVARRDDACDHVRRSR